MKIWWFVFMVVFFFKDSSENPLPANNNFSTTILPSSESSTFYDSPVSSTLYLPTTSTQTNTLSSESYDVTLSSESYDVTLEVHNGTKRTPRIVLSFVSSVSNKYTIKNIPTNIAVTSSILTSNTSSSKTTHAGHNIDRCRSRNTMNQNGYTKGAKKSDQHKDRRVCQRLSSRSCMAILDGDNDAASAKSNLSSRVVSRLCYYDEETLEEHLKTIIKSIYADSSVDESCKRLTLWFLCSLVFPMCTNQNKTNTFQNGTILLPCRSRCKEVARCYGTFRGNVFQHDSIFHDKFYKWCADLDESKNGTCADQIIELEQSKLKHLPKLIIIVGSACGTVVLVLFIVVAAIVCTKTHRIKRRLTSRRALSLYDVKEVHSNRTLQVSENCTNLGLTNPKYESVASLVDTLGLTLFSKENLVFDHDLGEGAFGKVVKCQTQNITHPTMGDIEMVAVKYLKRNAESEMELTFQRELEILSNFDHPNVIPLVGVCLDKTGPMCLILEFMKYGDLNQYIRLRSGSFHAIAGSCGDLPDGVEFQSPELSYHNLLSIVAQIADGLSYLTSKRFVHRDISTRNILVGENFRVKISDFGLAHDIYGSDYYRVNSQKLLPLRWLSPEALSLGKFTVHSDMFAFGVTMWEIFTYGMQPYYGYSNEEVCNMIRSHKLLERPYCCSPNIYALMKSCWKFEPRHRKDCLFIRDTISSWLEADEPFIQESWKRLMLPPLSERRPTILKSKKLNRFIKRDVTL